nr:escrt-iii complex subunit did4 [Quercus suber]
MNTVRSNEQMMQSMKGATQLLGSMNRQMNLPALQRIAMEFEKENDIMDQRQEMMDDAIDEVTGLEDEEEGEEVVNKVLDEIGVDLSQTVSAELLLHGTRTLTDGVNSSAKRHKDFNQTLWRKVRWRKPLVVLMLGMMIFRHDLTAYDDDDDERYNDRAYVAL